MLTVLGFCAAGAAPALRRSFASFGASLERHAGVEIALFEAKSYDDLATAVVSRYVDVAWLPPIPFASLARAEAVVPLVHLRRGGSHRFRSALLVRDDAPIRAPSDLAGKRAAWVDPSSASGFVIPRIELEALGVDPRTSFPRERFFHSHDAVVRAVVRGLADFGATYAGVSVDGVTRGPWTHAAATSAPIRVVALVGDIPGDVVAARSGLPSPVRERIRDSLLRISDDRKNRLLARGAFGVDEFCRFDAADYAAFARVVDDAGERGLLDVGGLHADDSGAHVLA